MLFIKFSDKNVNILDFERNWNSVTEVYAKLNYWRADVGKLAHGEFLAFFFSLFSRSVRQDNIDRRLIRKPRRSSCQVEFNVASFNGFQIIRHDRFAAARASQATIIMETFVAAPLLVLYFNRTNRLPAFTIAGTNEGGRVYDRVSRSF